MEKNNAMKIFTYRSIMQDHLATRSRLNDKKMGFQKPRIIFYHLLFIVDWGHPHSGSCRGEAQRFPPVGWICEASTISVHDLAVQHMCICGKFSYMCICGKYYKYTCGCGFTDRSAHPCVSVLDHADVLSGKKSLEEVLDATTSSVSHVSQSRQ